MIDAVSGALTRPDASMTVWIHGAGHVVAVVAEALRSTASQNVPVLEIVCFVDDGVVADITRVAESIQVGVRGGVRVGVRVVAVPEHPSDDAALLNTTLAESHGNYLLWLEASSSLAPEATTTIGAALERFEVDLLYADSVCVASHGRSATNIRRPIFSPIRLRGQDYLGDLRVFRVDRMRRVGGFRAGLRGAHPYDLALRLAADDATALHIPEPLTGMHGLPGIAGLQGLPGLQGLAGPVAVTNRRAVEDHLASLGLAGDVVPQPDGSLSVHYSRSTTPLVSIIIPTRGSRALIRGEERTLVVDAVRGIRERGSYTNVEFVIVADDETPQSVIDGLIEVGGEQLRLVRWSAPFNFSAKMNRGAVHARGEYLLLLNDDIELISPDWIEIMLGLAEQPDVGLVGSLLYFEDGSIQHGGHLYRDSWAGHIAWGWPPARDDLLGSMGVDREVSGVTAACAMVSADTYWSVGGFSTLYAGNYNDVDFALKVRASGKSIVWTPHARLYHFESKTRVATVAPSEIETLRRHWGTRLLLDPYWP